MESVALTIEKSSRYERRGERLIVGVPFPQGALERDDAVALCRGEQELYCQREVTGRWPDGSIKWLLLALLLDLDGRRDTDLSLLFGDGVTTMAMPPAERVTLWREGSSVRADTGAMSLLAGSGALLQRLSYQGRDLIGTGDSRGCDLATADGRRFSTLYDGDVTCEIEREGPLWSVIRLSGSYRDEAGNDGMAFSTRLHLWAGKPEVVIEHQFTNGFPGEVTEITEMTFATDLRGEGPRALTACRTYFTPEVTRSSERVSLEQLSYYVVEGVDETYNVDAFVDWQDASHGLVLDCRQISQNFPKALHATAGGIRADLYPASAPPLKLRRGMAKTHSLLLLAHPAGIGIDAIQEDTWYFQMPLVAHLPPDHYQRCGVFGDIHPDGPANYPRIESIITDAIDNRPRGLGMLDFGDEPAAGYTQQGRGKGDVVWLNNEYDLPHQYFRQFARTGERRFHDAAVAAAQHWLDVDVLHVCDDPRDRHGMNIHVAEHTRPFHTDPSHEWVEGLLDLYHMQGNVEARDVALGIGDHLVAFMAPGLDEGGEISRRYGWGLRAVLAIYEETGEARYLEAARQTVQHLQKLIRERGGLNQEYARHYLQPATFMVGLTLTSLWRYYKLTGEQAAADTFLYALDRLLEDNVNRMGLFYYKGFPSVRVHTASGSLALEAMAYAYRLTGNERYIRQGLRQLEYMLDQARMLVSNYSGAVVTTPEGRTMKLPALNGPCGQEIGCVVMPLLPYLAAAHELGLLKRLDFVY